MKTPGITLTLNAAADPAKRAAIEDEIADVLIYLLRLADICEIDPLAAASEKVERNAKRFPIR